LFAVTAALATSLLPLARRRPLPSLFLLTAAVVSVDLLLGARLIARSPLSGYAVAGIRFYGLGNEYEGVMIGMALLGPLAFEEQLVRHRWAQAIWLGGLLLLIGAPQVGADLGGSLAAAAGFSTTLALAAGDRRPARVGGVAVAATLVAALVFFSWDALRPASSRSHIGDFVHAVGSGGWSSAALLIRGKAAMGLRLLTSAYALIPILGVAPLLALWYHGAGRWLSTLFNERPEVRIAIGGAVVGSWVALLLNDSGVSSWMFTTVAVLMLLLDAQLRAQR
jgi:hypothetical protein